MVCRHGVGQLGAALESKLLNAGQTCACTRLCAGGMPPSATELVSKHHRGIETAQRRADMRLHPTMCWWHATVRDRAGQQASPRPSWPGRSAPAVSADPPSTPPGSWWQTTNSATSWCHPAGLADPPRQSAPTRPARRLARGGRQRTLPRAGAALERPPSGSQRRSAKPATSPPPRGWAGRFTVCKSPRSSGRRADRNGAQQSRLRRHHHAGGRADSRCAHRCDTRTGRLRASPAGLPGRAACVLVGQRHGGGQPTDATRGLADCAPARPGCPVAPPAFSSVNGTVVSAAACRPLVVRGYRSTENES